MEWNRLRQTGWNFRGKLFYAKAMNSVRKSLIAKLTESRLKFKLFGKALEQNRRALISKSAPVSEADALKMLQNKKFYSVWKHLHPLSSSGSWGKMFILVVSKFNMKIRIKTGSRGAPFLLARLILYKPHTWYPMYLQIFNFQIRRCVWELAQKLESLGTMHVPFLKCVILV